MHAHTKYSLPYSPASTGVFPQERRTRSDKKPSHSTTSSSLATSHFHVTSHLVASRLTSAACPSTTQMRPWRCWKQKRDASSRQKGQDKGGVLLVVSSKGWRARGCPSQSTARQTRRLWQVSNSVCCVCVRMRESE